ncbi:Aste57867_65 [Aphanomyces stellatus]|uniref:Sister chromatid cohesion protein n=1 Tax=Aphanomyces stellatus TaxID=120398 RepID=A0A485K4A2_9STRA|nr:hypothetical protein As57867_000065 [Aphanomyces stellatus]VFT77291.1 Aste57867_65 [Aphanomyces stellatus]
MMNRALPLFVPLREGEDESTSIWSLPPAPIVYAPMPPIDPSCLNMAALNTLLTSVPVSLLPDHDPPSFEKDNASPLLRAVVAQVPALSPNIVRKAQPAAPQTKQSNHKDAGHEEPASSTEKKKRSDERERLKDKRLSRIRVIEIEDDEDAPGTPTAGDTEESKKKLLVRKYQDELHGLVSQLSTSPDVPRATKKIMQTIKLIHKANKKLVSKLSFELLSDLMTLLDTKVSEALAIDLFAVAYADGGDADWEGSGIDTSKLQDVICAMDAASCMLYIMTSPNIDRRLLSEETIDHCIRLLKHVLQRLLFPSLDTVSLTQLVQEENGKVHPKYHGALKKKIEKVGLVHVASSFMETVEELVAGLKLQDSWILSLSNVLMSTLSLEGNTSSQSNIALLQVRASLMFRGIFLHYPAHRSLLLDDIFSVLLKLPTNKRNLRTYKLSNVDGHVQMVSMLLVTLAQACIGVSLDSVRDTSRSIVHSFMQRCMKKEEENDYRQVFENFVDDLLAMLLSPEWPAVELILEAMTAGLTNLMSQQKTSKLESQSSLLALNLLGKICATIRQISCDAKSQPIDEIEQPPALVELRDHAKTLLASKNVEMSKSNLVECMVLMYLGQHGTHVSEDAVPFYRAQCSFSDEFISLKSDIALSGDVARMLMTNLASHRKLCLCFDQMLMAIMAFLTRGQPTFRARVLKAVALIVDSDPLLMADDHLHKAITLCFSDEATSVRQAAVDLVGKHIGLEPSLFPRYYAMLADRLRDKGISVRKSVLKIFRTFLQLTPIEPEVAEWISRTLRALVERIGVPSEEESVKETVLTTVQDIWFGAPPPPPRRGSGSNTEAIVTPSSLKKKSSSNHKILTIIDVVHHVNNSEWIINLISRLMKKNISQIETACATMVSELMELLLQLEEGNTLPILSFKDPEAQRVATVKTLHVMCEASPELVKPYFDTLTVYLKQDNSLTKATQMQILAMAAGMISLVLPFMDKPMEKWMTKLEGDLKILVAGAPPQVVKPAVECLAVMTKSMGRPPKELLKILESMYKFLVKTETLVNLNKPISGMPDFLRSLFVVGLVAGSLEWDSLTDVTSDVFPPQKLVEMVYDVYARYTQVEFTNTNFTPALRVKTVQGLGYLLQRNPRMLLKSHEDNTLKTAILHNDPNVRTQILASLTELLQVEEARLEKLHQTQVAKQSKDHVQGDQEGDASLIGGVMQAQLENILKVAIQKEAPIRTQAMSCIGMLLTQGLVAPMKCIPTLVALETDKISSVRDTSYLHLVAINGKFPNMVTAPAVQGIYSSYQFQIRAFGKATICDAENVCYLGRMYRACIQGSRPQRNSFFTQLINLFRERGPIFTALLEKRLQPRAALGYLAYVSQILSALPYDVEDEPLYIVYTINREVSLNLGSVQDKMKMILGNESTFENMPVTEPIKPELEQVGYAAYALALLVRLKLALKESYQLENEKCQTFQTTTSTKANEVPVSRTKEIHPLDVQDMLVEEHMQNGWMHLTWLGDAAKEDQAQLDFDWENPNMKKKPKQKRGRKRKKKDDNDDGGDDEPADNMF